METTDTNIQGIEIASRIRLVSSTAIVCIHGLGDSLSSFESLFTEDSLRGLTLAAVDLPGCGQSAKPPGFSYSMADQADIVLQWLGKLDAQKVVLAGHSMGGVIGLYAAEKIPFERMAGFINVEGNLGPEDCVFSGRIASYAEEDFEGKGFEAYVRTLRKGTSSDPQPVMEQYAENFSKALPRAVYRSSVSLVEESEQGRLKERFRDLSAAKGYISGQRSLNPSTARYLAENGIPHFTVPDSGHFMMVEQPEAFCDAFRQTLEVMGVIGVQRPTSNV